VIVNDYNPTRNMAAVASLNCFFTYSLWMIYYYFLVSHYIH
jgi:hypothetical protein